MFVQQHNNNNMIVNPLRLVTDGIITHPDFTTLDDWRERKFISPNAIDFDIARAFVVTPQDDRPFCITKAKVVQHARQAEIAPVDHDGILCFVIPPRSCVDFMSNMFTSVPAGMCASLVVRSSLNRNQMFITSGLYDQGFSGNVAGILHNRSDAAALIEVGARIGQIIFHESQDSQVLYEGGYNTPAGVHWASQQ